MEDEFNLEDKNFLNRKRKNSQFSESNDLNSSYDFLNNLRTYNSYE